MEELLGLSVIITDNLDISSKFWHGMFLYHIATFSKVILVGTQFDIYLYHLAECCFDYSIDRHPVFPIPCRAHADDSVCMCCRQSADNVN